VKEVYVVCESLRNMQFIRTISYRAEYKTILYNIYIYCMQNWLENGYWAKFFI